MAYLCDLKAFKEQKPTAYTNHPPTCHNLEISLGCSIEYHLHDLPEHDAGTHLKSRDLTGGNRKLHCSHPSNFNTTMVVKNNLMATQ